MFKKIKKHRLSLFLLAMVGMLSVYYVLMPDDGPTAPVGGEIEGNIRYQAFAEARLEISTERNATMAMYEAKIIEAQVALTDVRDYVLEIETITKLTEMEVYLESVILNLGYEDSLVFYDENILNISVLAEKFSVEEYIEINKIAKEQFGKTTLVVLDFVNSSS